VFYVLCGASFVGAALGFFADMVVADNDNWYVNEQQLMGHLIKMDKYANGSSAFAKYFKAPYRWCVFNWEKIRALVVWVIFIICATIGSCMANDWPFVTGLYFAISSLSTGGLVALPAGSAEWMYFWTGFYAAFGVPLMGVAMATLAGFFMGGNSIDDAMAQITEAVTEDEVRQLEELGLADKDGQIDLSEYMILCMVRIGAADPNLILMIKECYESMDTDHSGGLSINEIVGKTMSTESVKHEIETVRKKERDLYKKTKMQKEFRRQSLLTTGVTDLLKDVENEHATPDYNEIELLESA